MKHSPIVLCVTFALVGQLGCVDEGPDPNTAAAKHGEDLARSDAVGYSSNPEGPIDAPASQGFAVHKDPSEIQVLYTRTVGRPSQVVGDVDADDQDADAALATLKQKAADMGADAVVGVQSEGAHLAGKAVRYR